MGHYGFCMENISYDVNISYNEWRPEWEIQSIKENITEENILQFHQKSASTLSKEFIGHSAHPSITL